MKLRGWAYYDPFLRFLYTIGPANAAMLKSLIFSGTVKLHTCDEDHCKRCDLDLVPSLVYLSVRYDGDDLEDYNFAEPTTQWLRERHIKKVRRERHEAFTSAVVQKNELTQKLEKVVETCGFCGEGHAWYECYSLCPCCGAYGHLRRKYPVSQRFKELAAEKRAEDKKQKELENRGSLSGCMALRRGCYEISEGD
ncbi:hypothetical protein G7Y89_g4205 [Cudoniella acicularis]|uniref:Uncharacterized protein n=1 Tax=Cudoniella acicularis TaxID=354080 RepID=A0A8H4W583_9HELO|nr:hypothetical protein G7Y89_g4205 [Cudoniella acicularis]